MERGNIYKLILSIVICQFAGIIGAVFTYNAIPTWYDSLIKPMFAPPNWVFAPIWITLYLLMGISLYLVLKKGLDRQTRIGLLLFGSQLALNSVWSILFFGLQNPFFALIEIAILGIHLPDNTPILED